VSKVSSADPAAVLRPIRGELVAAFEAVLDSGRYVLGEQVESFEREWAAFCGSTHAVGVSSGTDALALALQAAGVAPGDEVIVPAMTAVATWMAVCQIGAVPIGVDIDPVRNAIDPVLAAAALTSRTRALVAVHLYGMPADMPALVGLARKAGIALVEDAAQAHGAQLQGRRTGTMGDLAAFSFYPTKNLGAVGDAGAVTTSDAALADRLAMLRQYGWRSRDDSEMIGVNARLDEVQAALLRIALSRLDGETARRRSAAASYMEALAGAPGVELPVQIPDCEPAWHQFVIRHERRDELMAGLAQLGIGTAVHYPAPPPLQRAFATRSGVGRFPVAERHAATALSLPMHAGLEQSDLLRVADAVRRVTARI
jgi:dTDP-3-amino-3,4,6-trideoxy-alpha-D-glucose transaminase